MSLSNLARAVIVGVVCVVELVFGQLAARR